MKDTERDDREIYMKKWEMQLIQRSGADKM